MKFSLSCGFLIEWICLFCVLLLMQQLRGWKLSNNEQKSEQAQKANSYGVPWTNCMADGGKPSGDGLQDQSSNCPELHMLRAYVVSVREKVFLKRGQAWVKNDIPSKLVRYMDQSIFETGRPFIEITAKKKSMSFQKKMRLIHKSKI